MKESSVPIGYPKGQDGPIFFWSAVHIARSLFTKRLHVCWLLYVSDETRKISRNYLRGLPQGKDI